MSNSLKSFSSRKKTVSAGVKGIGELGNVGTAAAVANAVYHATGVRVRKLRSGWRSC
jgi:CO/xanthine dehydrogenase Mo-binding subunit